MTIFSAGNGHVSVSDRLAWFPVSIQRNSRLSSDCTLHPLLTGNQGLKVRYMKQHDQLCKVFASKADGSAAMALPHKASESQDIRRRHSAAGFHRCAASFPSTRGAAVCVSLVTWLPLHAQPSNHAKSELGARRPGVRSISRCRCGWP